MKFSRKLTRPYRAPAGSTKDLKDRVQRLEKALAEHGVGSGVNTTPDTSASPSRLSDTRSTPQPAQAGSSHQSSCPAEGEQQQRDVALGQMYFAGQNLGELCARNGVPFFSPDGRQWIFSVTGQWPCFDSINFEREDGRINNNQDISRHNLAETSRNLVRLPKRSEFETRLSQFLTQDIVGVFPFVDEVLIHHTIQTAYEVGQTPQNRGQINAKACVLALFAVMSTHLDHGDTTSPMSPNEYSKEAKRLLISEGIEEATIVTLQTIVLLVSRELLVAFPWCSSSCNPANDSQMMHEVPYGRLASAHMLHATACRAAFALGGHRISPPTPMNRPLTLHEREDLFLRDLFWLCYKLDKDIALRTGQPPLINDDFCNLSLPEGYLDGRFKALSLQSSSDEALSSRRTPQLPGDLRLDLLKAKVCKLLYSAESSQKSDAELLRTIRELDDELERWRVSIPAKFSPSMSVSASGTLDTELDTPMRMLHIELHLEYNHLLAVIHCASGRCTLSTNGTGKGDPGYGVQSSLQLSVEASRSTLIYLKAAGHRIASEAFW